jgi:hypothetical protein
MNTDDLDKKLKRFHNFIVPSEPASASEDVSAPRRYLRLGKRLNGELVRREEGTYCLIRTLFPFGFGFGDCRLAHRSVETIDLSAFSVQQREDTAALSAMLFFDTETTGLGGSGAVAFLIGVGSLTDQGFEIRQYLLPDYPDEPGMLEDILEEFAGESTMVSYNGAAFDLPLVRDRMIITRVARNFEPSRHLDLLHPTRRLFRRRLQDCSLTNIEREIFNFHRVEDIPGYLIPSVYFSWLADESLDLMMPVLEHNRLDILALYFLTLHLHEVFQTEGGSLEAADDIHSLSRIYGRRKQPEQVNAMYRRLAESDEEIAPDALYFHSLALKQAGLHEEAILLWNELAQGGGREAFRACLELAKHHEHRSGDLTAALAAAEQARKLLPDSRSQREALQRRLARLRTKHQLR